jgi:hypothetical protein
MTKTSHMRTQNIKFILYQIQEKQLFTQPDYQRNLVWSEKYKCELIKTILNHFIIPTIYIHKKPDYTIEVIDGQQRLTTICDFVNNKFKYNKKYYKELTKEEQNTIQCYELNIMELNNYNLEEIIEQFNLINHSVNMSEAEKIYSRNDIPIIDYLKDISIKKLLLNLEEHSNNNYSFIKLPNKRMQLFKFLVISYAILDPKFEGKQYNLKYCLNYFNKQKEINLDIFESLKKNFQIINDFLEKKSEEMKKKGLYIDTKDISYINYILDRNDKKIKGNSYEIIEKYLVMKKNKEKENKEKSKVDKDFGISRDSQPKIVSYEKRLNILVELEKNEIIEEI